MKLYYYGKSFQGGLSLGIGTLYQVEELSLMRGGVMPDHIQFCDEITYAISGKARIYADNTVTDITGGQIHYIRKGCNHKIEVYPDEDFRYICIGYTLKENSMPSAFHAFMQERKHFTVQDNAVLQKLCPLLVDEFYTWDDWSNDVVTGYLYQILIATFRTATATIHPQKSRSDSEKANFTVYRALRYIDKNFLHIEKIKEISRDLSYNENYLSHLFREKTGTTLKDYITRKKIEHACMLFQSSPWSVEEIAAHLNYASAHAFRRAFKSVTGKTPSEYKK